MQKAVSVLRVWQPLKLKPQGKKVLTFWINFIGFLKHVITLLNLKPILKNTLITKLNFKIELQSPYKNSLKENGNLKQNRKIKKLNYGTVGKT